MTLHMGQCSRDVSERVAKNTRPHICTCNHACTPRNRSSARRDLVRVTHSLRHIERPGSRLFSRYDDYDPLHYRWPRLQPIQHLVVPKAHVRIANHLFNSNSVNPACNASSQPTLSVRRIRAAVPCNIPLDRVARAQRILVFGIGTSVSTRSKITHRRWKLDAPRAKGNGHSRRYLQPLCGCVCARAYTPARQTSIPFRMPANLSGQRKALLESRKWEQRRCTGALIMK